MYAIPPKSGVTKAMRTMTRTVMLWHRQAFVEAIMTVIDALELCQLATKVALLKHTKWFCFR